MNKDQVKFFEVNGIPVKFRMTQKGAPRFESWDTKKPQPFQALDVYKEGREISEKEFNHLVKKFR